MKAQPRQLRSLTVECLMARQLPLMKPGRRRNSAPAAVEIAAVVASGVVVAVVVEIAAADINQSR
jgi:hypothetical protein